jgi:hypothetical protein
LWPAGFTPEYHQAVEVARPFDVLESGEEAGEATRFAITALNTFVMQYTETLNHVDLLQQQYKQTQKKYLENNAQMVATDEVIERAQVKLDTTQTELAETRVTKQQVQEEYLSQTDLVGVEKDILNDPEAVDREDPNKAIAEVMGLEGFDPFTGVPVADSVQVKKDKAESEYHALCKRERELAANIRELQTQLQNVSAFRENLGIKDTDLVNELQLQYEVWVAALDQLKALKIYPEFEVSRKKEDV